MKNITNSEFIISENTVDILDGIKVTEIQPKGYNYSLIKTSVLSNLVSDLDRAKKLLEDNNIRLNNSSMSVINKEINNLKSEINTKDSNLDVLQNEVDMLIYRVNKLQSENAELRSENDELKKLGDKNVIIDNALLNKMYYLGYLNYYLTRGSLLTLAESRFDLSLEEFRAVIDKLIELRDKNN